MKQEYQASAPVRDDLGDVWISRKWVDDLMPDLRPVEFLWLVCREARLPMPRMSRTTAWKIRAVLRGKGLL